MHIFFAASPYKARLPIERRYTECVFISIFVMLRGSLEVLEFSKNK